jgi:von Willebrand factor type A domain
MRALRVVFGCALTALVACGSTNGGSLLASAGGSSNASGGLGGSSGGSSGGTAGSGVVIGGSGGGGGMPNPDAGCATSTAVATAIPPVLEFVIDISGSMNDAAPGTASSKWVVTRNALATAFSNMPANNAVGLFFFPGTAGTPCIDKQQAVTIAALGATGSAQRTSITQALAGAHPTGGTPTHDAYLFGLNTLLASTLPGNKFIVLITDGAPTYELNCQGDGHTPVSNGPLITQVQDAAKGGVRTFVIGSPGSEPARTDLSTMAQVGGTGLPGCSNSGPNYCHFDMTTQPDLATGLNNALAQISGAALSCTYDVPAPPNGQQLDPNKVNVEYTPSSGSPTEIDKDSGSTCTNGWQYSPDGKQIIICGSDCNTIKNDPGGKINIVFGCQTNVQ